MEHLIVLAMSIVIAITIYITIGFIHRWIIHSDRYIISIGNNSCLEYTSNCDLKKQGNILKIFCPNSSVILKKETTVSANLNDNIKLDEAVKTLQYTIFPKGQSFLYYLSIESKIRTKDDNLTFSPYCEHSAIPDITNIDRILESF